MAFWFCGKSWREKQRHKGAPEGGSRRNPWCPVRPPAPAPPTQQPVPGPTLAATPPPPPPSSAPGSDLTFGTAPGPYAQHPRPRTQPWTAAPLPPGAKARQEGYGQRQPGNANPGMGLLPPCLICQVRTRPPIFGSYRFCLPGRCWRKTPPLSSFPPKIFKPKIQPG